MGLFKRKSKENVNTQVYPVDKQDMLLYLLVENQKSGIVEYFKEHGVEITKIFESIEDAKVEMLIAVNKVRLVIIENGNGRFITSEARSDIADLVGMADGDSKRVTVLYTNSCIRTDIRKKNKRALESMDIAQYSNTVGVLNKLNSYNERYNSGGASDIQIDKKLDFEGERVRLIGENQAKRELKTDLLKLISDESGDSIRKFEVTY